ncbi:hypothetical protein CBS101457_003641 [Exobasidium rhododendri]|nr:hypothetical protein CBS101457_003641 [Exobasidium rhododendri]
MDTSSLRKINTWTRIAHISETSKLSVNNDENNRLIWDAYEDLQDELDDTDIPSKLTTATQQIHAEIDALLRGILKEFVSRESTITRSADDYLCKNAQVKLPLKFWKLAVIFFKQPKKANRLEPAVRDEPGVKSSITVVNLMHQAFASVHRLTNQQVDKDMRVTVFDYVASLDLPSKRIEKKIITFQDYQRLMIKGVFCTTKNPHFHSNDLYHCGRERLQTGVFLALLMYTAARPGELLVSSPYAGIAEDALKWKDVIFYVKLVNNDKDESAEPLYLLECDVYIRNLKGMRRDPTKSRIVNLYEDLTIPRACDATVLLAALADMDGIFGYGISIMDCSKTCRAEYFDDASRTRVFIKPEMAETYVFRTVECQDHRWITSTNTPLLYKQGCAAAHRAMKLANLERFDLYAFRRAAGNALQTASVSDKELCNFMGHQEGSRTFSRYYQTKRTTVDAQGLIVHGRQKEVVTARPLARTLNCFLDTKEILDLDADSKVVLTRKNVEDARLEKQQTRNKVKILKDNGQDDGAEYAEALKALNVAAKQESQALNHWIWIRNARQRELIKQKEKGLLEEYTLKALGQTSSISTQELSFTESLNDILEISSDEMDGSEEETERIADTSNEELLSARDDLIAQISSLRGKEELTSMVCDSDEDSICTTSSTTTATTTATTPSTSTPSSTSEKSLASHAAQQIEQQLKALSESISPFCFPLLDASALFSTETVDLSLAYQILASEVGTLDHDRYAGYTDRCCPECKRFFGTQFNPRHFVNHVVNCAQKEFLKRAKEIIYSNLGGKKCVSPGCRAKSSTFGDTLDTVIHHSYQHLRTQRIVGYDRRLSNHKCNLRNEKEVPCLYVCRAQSDTSLAEYERHLETCHGILDGNRIDHCFKDGIWSIGNAQLEAHAKSHYENDDYEEATSMLGDQWSDVACKFCYHDESLRMSLRVRSYPARRSLVSHILNLHIIPRKEERLQCGLCDEVVFAPDYPDHLIVEHDLHLSSGHVTERIGHDYNLLMSPIPKARAIFNDWTSWMESLLSVEDDIESTQSSVTAATASPSICTKRTRMTPTSEKRPNATLKIDFKKKLPLANEEKKKRKHYPKKKKASVEDDENEDLDYSDEIDNSFKRKYCPRKKRIAEDDEDDGSSNTQRQQHCKKRVVIEEDTDDSNSRIDGNPSKNENEHNQQARASASTMRVLSRIHPNF